MTAVEDTVTTLYRCAGQVEVKMKAEVGDGFGLATGTGSRGVGRWEGAITVCKPMCTQATVHQSHNQIHSSNSPRHDVALHRKMTFCFFRNSEFAKQNAGSGLPCKVRWQHIHVEKGSVASVYCWRSVLWLYLSQRKVRIKILLADNSYAVEKKYFEMILIHLL